jgi:hypothetical protein
MIAICSPSKSWRKNIDGHLMLGSTKFVDTKMSSFLRVGNTSIHGRTSFWTQLWSSWLKCNWENTKNKHSKVCPYPLESKDLSKLKLGSKAYIEEIKVVHL